MISQKLLIYQELFFNLKTTILLQDQICIIIKKMKNTFSTCTYNQASQIKEFSTQNLLELHSNNYIPQVSNFITDSNHNMKDNNDRQKSYEKQDENNKQKYENKNLIGSRKSEVNQMMYKINSDQKNIRNNGNCKNLNDIFEVLKFWNIQNRQIYAQPKVQKIEDCLIRFQNQLYQIIQTKQILNYKWESPPKWQDQSSSMNQYQSTNQKYRNQLLAIIQTLNEKNEYIEFLENELNNKNQIRDKYIEFNRTNNGKFQSPYSIYLAPWDQNEIILNSFERVKSKQYLGQLNNFSAVSNSRKQFMKNNKEIKMNNQMNYNKIKINELSEIKNKDVKKQLYYKQLHISRQIDLLLNPNTIKNQISQKYRYLLKKYLQITNLNWMILYKLVNHLKEFKKYQKFVQIGHQYLDYTKKLLNNTTKWYVQMIFQSNCSFNVMSLISKCHGQMTPLFESNDYLAIIKGHLNT